jgi:dihydrofolate reductase
MAFTDGTAMGKIILSTPITLDGFIEGPHRELDWVVADDELHDYYADLLHQADLLLYGRVTYELMVNYWPNAISDPNASAAMKRFATALNPMRKLVFSKTLKHANWNTQIKQDVIPEEIRIIKSETRREILLSGGETLAKAFISFGLVDEFQLMVQPVAIGEGKSLLRGVGSALKMDFKWCRAFRSGAMVICYHPGKNI